jgi:hypothetical protein
VRKRRAKSVLVDVEVSFSSSHHGVGRAFARLREIGEVDSLNNSYYESLGKPSNQSALFSRNGWNSIPKWHPITIITNPENKTWATGRCFPLLVCTSHDGIVRGTFIVPFVNVVDSYNPSADGNGMSS